MTNLKKIRMYHKENVYFFENDYDKLTKNINKIDNNIEINNIKDNNDSNKNDMDNIENIDIFED